MCNARVSFRGLLIIGVVGMLCAWSLAAERPTETPGTPTQQRPEMQQRAQAAPAMMLARSSELIGKKVENRQGQDLGKVYDLVLTSDLQQVSYLALARGGVLGVGAKLYAIPWQAVQMGPENKIIVPVTAEQLEAAPGFDEDNWPGWGDPRWVTGMIRRGQAYEREQQPGQPTERESTAQEDRERSRETPGMRGEGRAEMAAATQDVQYRRLTHLTGMHVKNDKGEDFGNIEDFVIDARNGRVAYTIVSFGGFWGIGEKYAAVPYNAIDLQPRRNIARLEADRQTLESIAFEPGKFPDLTNRQYAQRIHEAFDVEPYWTVYGYVPPAERRAAEEQTWGPQSQFARQFDADKIETMQGTVESVGTFRPEGAAPGIADGLRLRVKTDEGKSVTVYVGPHWYARQQNFYLMPGDKITVTGSDTKIGWRSVIVPTEIKKDDKTLQLRDKTGRPQWKWQPQSQQMQRPGQPMPQRQPGGQTPQ